MAEDIRQHLLNSINKFRREHNLSELSLDEELSRNAKAHSEHRVERLPEIGKGPLSAHTEQHLMGKASAPKNAHTDEYIPS